MKKVVMLGIILVLFVVSGCESKFGSAAGGAVVGGAAGVGGYEYHLRRQLDRIEQDYKDGKLDVQEYAIRKNQIERDSLIR